MDCGRTSTGDVAGLILSAGMQVLDEYGESALTVRTVAESAGVAPMGVYNHFGSKSGFLVALMNEGFGQLGEIAFGPDMGDGSKRLRSVGDSYHAFALGHPNLYRLMFSGKEDSDPDVRRRVLTSLAQVIRSEQVAGTIREGDSHTLAQQVWSCVHGAVETELGWAAPGGSTSPGLPSWDHMSDLLCRGLAP